MRRAVGILAWILAISFLAISCGRVDDRAGLKSTDNGLVYISGEAGILEAPPLSAPGRGAGEWNSTPWTSSLWAEAKAIRAFLATGYARQRYGREACEAFSHYFDNTGLIWTFDAGKLALEVPHVAAIMEREMARAVAFARSMPAGHTEFTSRAALSARIERHQSLNWYLAVADFSYYVTGTVERDACGAGCSRADIMFHVWDRYDWDAGPVVRLNTPIGPIDVDQEHVGEFHRQGLAREFTSIGIRRYRVEFENCADRSCKQS